MPDQARLSKAIKDDLNSCRTAARFQSKDETTRQRSDLKFSALTTHLMWAESVGDEQTEPESVVRSLEANPVLTRLSALACPMQTGIIRVSVPQ